MFLKNCVENAYIEAFPGSRPVIHGPHPPGSASPPIGYPGNIALLLLSGRPPEIFLSAVSCGAVRQASLSWPLQSRLEGSKRQCAGFSMTPSFTPSSVSHAASAAACIAGSLAAGIYEAGSFIVACTLDAAIDNRCVQ